MITKAEIAKIVEKLIENSDIFLVDVVVSASKIRTKISILLDTDQGIGIDECSNISHLLGAELEEIIENAYVLEVSSPGADSPIKLDRQFSKNLGRTLKIKTKEGEEIVGKLILFENEYLTIQPEKIKKLTPEPIIINKTEILEAKVVISFK